MRNSDVTSCRECKQYISQLEDKVIQSIYILKRSVNAVKQKDSVACAFTFLSVVEVFSSE